jgi:hypothetical protein
VLPCKDVVRVANADAATDAVVHELHAVRHVRQSRQHRALDLQMVSGASCMRVDLHSHVRAQPYSGASPVVGAGYCTDQGNLCDTMGVVINSDPCPTDVPS